MHPYNSGVPRHLAKPRPKQAARLVALRKAAGLSQAELAKLVRVSPKTIGFWETSAVPPRSDVLPLLAHLDQTGMTRRRGDYRIAGPRLPAACRSSPKSASTPMRWSEKESSRKSIAAGRCTWTGRT